MIVTLHSTDKIVELTLNGQTLPARLWEGETASGIACHAFITRIAVHQDLDASEFERELQEKHAPVSAAQIGITESEVVDALLNAPSIRPDRFTILSQKKLNREMALELARSTGVI